MISDHCYSAKLIRVDLLTYKKNFSLQNKLYEINPHIFAGKEEKKESVSTTTCYSPALPELISGALEAAFLELDETLYNDIQVYDIQGGCTAIVALFAESKLYVANAGDCR